MLDSIRLGTDLVPSERWEADCLQWQEQVAVETVGELQAATTLEQLAAIAAELEQCSSRWLREAANVRAAYVAARKHLTQESKR